MTKINLVGERAKAFSDVAFWREWRNTYSLKHASSVRNLLAAMLRLGKAR